MKSTEKRIEIKNLKTDNIQEWYDVRVDRVSVFGSPFYISKSQNRREVLKKYALWFKKKVRTDPTFNIELNRLYNLYQKYGKLNLFCWCYPKSCHAKTIRAYLLKLERNENRDQKYRIKKRRFVPKSEIKIS